MIDTGQFLAKVEEIAAEEPSYRSGGSGTDGTCDCIGLIIGAIRRAGGSWRGTHGSNYAARNEIKSLNHIDSVSQLTVGEAVFKARNPGDAKYALPSGYSGHPDQHDYYHVGVVISVSPLMIRHMTTPKPIIDTKLGKWGYHGWLKKITATETGSETGEKPQMNEPCIIKGGNESSTINMRSGPAKDRKIIYDVPQGSEGILLEVVNDNWCKVQVGNKVGYIQQVFVRHKTSDSTPTDKINITVPSSELEQIYNTIGNWLGRRG